MWSWLGAVGDTDQPTTWAAVLLGALNVFQTVALAYMAGRSRRVRRQDRDMQRIGRSSLDERAR